MCVLDGCLQWDVFARECAFQCVLAIRCACYEVCLLACLPGCELTRVRACQGVPAMGCACHEVCLPVSVLARVRACQGACLLLACLDAIFNHLVVAGYNKETIQQCMHACTDPCVYTDSRVPRQNVTVSGF